MAEDTKLAEEDKGFLKKYVPISAFIGGLCCFTPVVVVLFGLGSVSYAASLSDLLYGQYAWVFRSAGLLFVLAALGIYLYREQGVCSIDEAKRQRNRIINLVAATVGLAALGYVVWLYGIVELMGLALGIW